MLQDKIAKLQSAINELEDINEITLSKLEEQTADIINDDKFDELPNEIQDAIYLIDMHEIEHPTLDQISQIKEKLLDYSS